MSKNDTVTGNMSITEESVGIAILRALRGHPMPISQTSILNLNLAPFLGRGRLPDGNCRQEAIEWLVRNGFLVKGPGQRGRGIVYKLTDKGRSELQKEARTQIEGDVKVNYDSEKGTILIQLPGWGSKKQFYLQNDPDGRQFIMLLDKKVYYDPRLNTLEFNDEVLIQGKITDLSFDRDGFSGRVRNLTIMIGLFLILVILYTL